MRGAANIFIVYQRLKQMNSILDVDRRRTRRILQDPLYKVSDSGDRRCSTGMLEFIAYLDSKLRKQEEEVSNEVSSVVS
jgi:hypothetical protein